MARRLRTRSHGIGRDLLKGAVAGAVATFVMGKVTGYMYEHEDREARREEDEARGGRSSYEVAAERTASAAPARPTPSCAAASRASAPRREPPSVPHSGPSSTRVWYPPLA